MSYSDEINILLLDEYNIGDEFILDIWDEEIIDQDVAHIIYHVELHSIYGKPDTPIYQFIIKHSSDIDSTASYITIDTSSAIIMQTHKIYFVDHDYIPPKYPIRTKFTPHLYTFPHRRHGGRKTSKRKISKKKKILRKRKSIRKRNQIT